MDILHLTDLHVTPPNSTLGGVWVTVADQLRAVDRTKFDFIVVSGDLTQSAERRQYDDLAKFTRDVLMKLLRDPDDRRRIVFVPGNHDVQWKRSGLERYQQSPTATQLDDIKRRPHSAELRAAISKAGKLEYARRQPKSYGHRFSECRRFLTRFYGAKTASPHRSFQLTSHDARDHWSAHVFPEEHVAFFGFNSCFYNDAMWRGATLEEDAITAAVAHAREHARDLDWIAVWHHGLASERGQPDHLVTRDLGMLRFAGFHLGIHGHTHLDSFHDQRELLGDRFPIIASGSFAAGPDERPEGALNQFSIIELSSSYIVVDRFERLPSLEWRRRRLAPYVRSLARETPLNTAERHSRVFHLDLEDGISEATVSFQQIDVNSDLILAEPAGQYSNMIPGETHADGSRSITVETKAADGRTRVKFAGTTRSYDTLKWSARLSNVLARDRADLAMREPSEFAKRLRESTWQDYDFTMHRVRVHSRKLHLAISTSRAKFFDSKAFGLRAFDANDDERAAEATRSRPVVSKDRKLLEVNIDRPLVGYRYVLGYRVREPGRLCSPAVRTMLSNVVELLRSGLPRDPAREALTAEVEDGLRYVLGAARTKLTWWGYLWNDRRQRLQVSFGRCPWSSAGSEFVYGKGVVGHAFRQGAPASYYAAEAKSSVLLEGQTDYEWIVAVPILLGVKEPAVGVIGFAGRGERGWDRNLRDFAREVYDLRAVRSEPVTTGKRAGTRSLKQREDWITNFETNILQVATLFFWQGLFAHVANHLGDGDQATVDHAFAKLKRGFQAVNAS